MAKSSNVANIGFKGDAIIYAGVNNLIKNQVGTAFVI
jgi:hypothetical protein